MSAYISATTSLNDCITVFPKTLSFFRMSVTCPILTRTQYGSFSSAGKSISQYILSHAIVVDDARTPTTLLPSWTHCQRPSMVGNLCERIRNDEGRLLSSLEPVSKRSEWLGTNEVSPQIQRFLWQYHVLKPVNRFQHRVTPHRSERTENGGHNDDDHQRDHRRGDRRYKNVEIRFAMAETANK